MASSLTQTAAALHRLCGRQTGRAAIDTVSQAVREQIQAEADALGIDAQTLIERTADAGDDKDRRIALLEAHLLNTSDRLAAWLTDNTEEAFEEQPEIDSIRSDIDDVMS